MFCLGSDLSSSNTPTMDISEVRIKMLICESHIRAYHVTSQVLILKTCGGKYSVLVLINSLKSQVIQPEVGT